MQCGIVGKIEGHQSHPDLGLKSDSKIPNSVPRKHDAGSLNLSFLLCEMGAMAPTPVSRRVRKHWEGVWHSTLAWPPAVQDHCSKLPESPQTPHTGPAPSLLSLPNSLCRCQRAPRYLPSWLEATKCITQKTTSHICQHNLSVLLYVTEIVSIISVLAN